MFNININTINATNCTINCNMSSGSVDEDEGNLPLLINRDYFIFDNPLGEMVFTIVDNQPTKLFLTQVTIGNPRQRFTSSFTLGMGYTFENVLNNGFILPLGTEPGSEVGLQFLSTSPLRFWRIEEFVPLGLNSSIAVLRNAQTGLYLKVDPDSTPIFSIVENRDDATKLGFANCIA